MRSNALASSHHSPAAPCNALHALGDRVQPLVSADDLAGYELFDVSTPKDRGPPPHEHPWSEVLYVLEGALAFELERDEQRAGPGGVVLVPAHVQHAGRLLSQRTRCIALNSPAGAHVFFGQRHERVGAMPDDLPAVVEVAKAHGLRSPPSGE